MVEISPFISYKVARVYTRQAYPAAEDAKPAAVGKLFTEQIEIFQFKQGKFGSARRFTKIKIEMSNVS